MSGAQEAARQPEQKCTFIGCENRGVPQEGFDFFICDPCFIEFDRLLREKAAEANHD